MSKAALQASNTSSQNLIAGASINVGSLRLKFGRDIAINSGNIAIKTCGYYTISQNVVIQPTGIGPVAVKLQHNGIDIPGAIAYGYATVADQNVSLSIPSTLIRVKCGDGCPCETIPDTLTTVLVEGPGVVTSVLTNAVRQ